MADVAWDVPAAEWGSAPDGFVAACQAAPDHVVYFLLNVGDGDTQLILLPADAAGARRGVIVDVATTRKLPALLEALERVAVLPPPDTARVFPVVVATHPHADHIGGIAELLRRRGHQIDELWDPGYYHPSGVFNETMVALEEQPFIQRTQPTSGMVRHLGGARLTVIAPGVGLRSRFDSYGVHINDASIALRLDYPAARVAEVDSGEGRERVYVRDPDPGALLLGADAQTTSWAQATVDFPQLHGERNPELTRELRLGMGADPLRAQVFKVPHHASVRGLNLELVERIRPRLVLVSCSGGGRYRFPHHLAVESVREALQPTVVTGDDRPPDHRLGLHYTCARLVEVDGAAQPLGSIALLLPPGRRRQLQLWRFGDAPDELLDLERGRLAPAG
ncbi:MAG: ComEC/Rec2 family competence protein [Egibacteraceae bacterium]